MKVKEIAELMSETTFRFRDSNIDAWGFLDLSGENVMEYPEFEWLTNKEVLGIEPDYERCITYVDIRMGGNENGD